MGKVNIIRAWKDEQYRNSLSAEELAQMPDNPAGQIELDDVELLQATGAKTIGWFTAGCCHDTDFFCNVTQPPVTCTCY